jgi:hypothetical protein
VLRGTVSGGPYTALVSGLGSPGYTDKNVQSGATYYYVSTATGASGLESAYSNQAAAIIPTP